MSTSDDPCIKICTFDADGLCLGCHRTKVEVKGWKRMDPARRAAILSRIAPLMGPDRGKGKAAKKLRKLDRKIAKLTVRMEKLRRARAELAA